MNHFIDKKFECIDCGDVFIFSALEQEYYRDNGFKNTPHRCPSCREKNSGSPALKVHLAKCKKCGGRALLNFQPVNPKAVECLYCRKARLF